MKPFDFQSFQLKRKEYFDTKIITWYGKHKPVFVLTYSNLKGAPVFLCNSNPKDLADSLVCVLDDLYTRSEAQQKWENFEIETSKKITLIFCSSVLNQHRCGDDGWTLKTNLSRHMNKTQRLGMDCFTISNCIFIQKDFAMCFMSFVSKERGTASSFCRAVWSWYI